MAFVNLVPKLYRSIIEDVIEGVQDLFAAEGIEEHVLKDLKKLWETKVAQSKATEDFLRSSVSSPVFTFQLPHSLPTTLQSTASLVIPAGRTLPGFTSEELSTFNPSANFAFSGYPIHVPAGVTLQTASGHLYKVNVPVMVTQTPGRARVVPHPFQQVFQQLGQPSLIEAGIPPLHQCSLQAATEKPPRVETVLQQPTVLLAAPVDRKHLENATSDRHVLPGNDHQILSQALLRQQESSPCLSLASVGFPPQISQKDPLSSTMLSVPASSTPNQLGTSFSHQGALYHHTRDPLPPGLQDRTHECDDLKELREAEEPSSLPASEKNSNSEMDLNIQVTDDVNEIIQIDGTGDVASSEETGSMRDVDENEFIRDVNAGDLKVLDGIVDVGDLKELEGEADSVSNEGSTTNNSDSEDRQIDAVEEDPLNSGDDVSEQDVPDLFDTDNVIVCQYDKIHRSKNRWKFYLKDGVMCFGGRDYVFAKAIGDAEW